MRDAAVALVLTFAAALLRISYLNSKSFTLDEGFSAYMARADVGNFLRYIRGGEVNMVVYYALLRLWTHVGYGPFAIRLLSVLAALATIPVVYALGARLFDRRVALVAALLLTVHPAHVAFSQEARSYALAVLLASVSSLLFLRALDRRSTGNWAFYIVVSALGIYSHFFVVLVLVAQWLSLAVAPIRPPLRTSVKILATFAPLIVPILIFVAPTTPARAAWIPALTGHNLLVLFYFLGLSKLRLLVYVVLWGIALWTAVSLRRRPAELWPYAFATGWLFVPLVLTIAVSVFRPLLVPRFLLVCVPAVVLLAAAGCVRLADFNRCAATALLVLAVFFSMSAVRFHFRHSDLNPDWRGATAYVIAHGAPHDQLWARGYARFVVEYYYRLSGAHTPHLAGDVGSAPPRRIWSLYDAITRAEAQPLPEAYCSIEQHDFNGVIVTLADKCR